MTIPQRQTFDSVDPRWQIQVTDDGSPTLVDRASGDAMHSGCGALAETEHVYVQNGGVASRLAAQLPTSVLEVGLGSGLAFLWTAERALRDNTPLLYVALEQVVAPGAVVRQLDFARYGIRVELIEAFCGLLDAANEESILCLTISNVTLRIVIGDAANSTTTDLPSCDAIYFDPYSPTSNPAMWTTAVFRALRKTLAGDGRLVSYCVNRRVRDSLIEAGFKVDRVPGPPGGKREVLVASMKPAASPIRSQIK